MAIGIVGKKIGMTQVYENGIAVPVSVIHADPNFITQVKTLENDGYSAIQVTLGKRKRTRVNKPITAHFAKANVEPGIGLWEFRVHENTIQNLGLQTGASITVEQFNEIGFVDVTGRSIGKGFQGTIKKGFRGQDRSHGNSLSHRVPGSIGQNQSPGRVFPGKIMSGHMGNKRVTKQSLKLVKIDSERNLLLVKGAIPGAKNGIVIVKPAVKKVKQVAGE